MKNILFVCIENSCRSQMAEAFAKIHGKEKANAFSAGSKPSGKINSMASQVMKEIGYDLSKHKSKSLDEIPKGKYEYAVTMGCEDECPFVLAMHRIDWQIPDPKNLPLDEFRKIRNDIEKKVKQLLDKL